MAIDMSSPFVEHPDDFNADDSTRQIVSKLQFQVASARTEQQLLVESKKEQASKYEALLKAKNDELEALKTNFEFVYGQREALKSKLENSEQISSKSVRALEAAHRDQKSTVARLERENHELQSELSRSACRREQEQNSIQYLEDENVQLHERMEELERVNGELIERQQQQQQQEHDRTAAAGSVSSYAASLKSQKEQLQKTNTELQLKVDSLLQHKTSVEILKQKNLTLQAKVQTMEAVQERCYELEIENIDLQRKFEEFREFVDASAPSDANGSGSSGSFSVKEFLARYKTLQNNNLVLQDKFNSVCIQLDQANAEVERANDEKTSDLIPKIQSLNEVLKDRQTLIEKLEKQKLLNVKEIEFLRESLKGFDNLSGSAPTGGAQQQSAETAAKNEIDRLQKLVELHKGARDSLEERLRQVEQERAQERAAASAAARGSSGAFGASTSTTGFGFGGASSTSPFGSTHKRPRSNDDDDTIHTAHLKLEKENTELLATIKSLQGETSSLRQQILQLQQVQHKKEQLKVLQLRSNYITKDQVVKQETLDLLRKENSDLLASSTRAVETVPRSVFERQENDKQILQTKIDQLTKRISRLREVYSKKSCDILTIISKFFGYSVEFLPSPMNPEDLTSSRIKLVSKYTKHDTKDKPYLVIDVHSRSLKANGSTEFKSLCEELVKRWVNQKDQIPCFLGALNLQLYDLN